LKKILSKKDSMNAHWMVEFTHAVTAEKVEEVAISPIIFFIGDGSDSTRHADRRRERADNFCLFQARLPQAHNQAKAFFYINDEGTRAWGVGAASAPHYLPCKIG